MTLGDANSHFECGQFASQNHFSRRLQFLSKVGVNLTCVDRKLNKLTVADPQPKTRAEELFQRLGKAKYFFKINLGQGHWQISDAKANSEKTAFIKPDGTYNFSRMRLR